ncbi:acyltransferase [Moheibacter sediminis]|uniref:Acetyltransferase (Isoleucine patch superfamily) n=1 Tax=Moheibacter sediminis TaxID=1434700 RepID=A0A1W1YYI4_9FLAO|nr:acyltransferase [Moheibacter sediminis]SMC40758.1 Acetyltransferase (isoleucine patch superfamily) [Moheibacter sediminis]
MKEKVWQIIEKIIEKAALRKKKNDWNFLVSKPNVNIHDSFNSFYNNNIFLLDDSAKITIKEGVNTRKYCEFLVWNEAELIISKNVFFNNSCSINCLEKIEIGEDTLFGENVKLYDHNHLISKTEKISISKDQFSTAPIKIGKNCWIASNVTILKGVTIGNNVVIGAGCLIHKSIPSNTIVKNIQNLQLETNK